MAKSRRSDTPHSNPTKANAQLRPSVDLLNDPPTGWIMDAGTYGADGTADDGGLFMLTKSGQRVHLEDVLTEIAKSSSKGRRQREPRIPWADVNALVAGRLGLHGLPQDLPSGSAHAQLVQMIEDALAELSAEASRSMIQQHATILLRTFDRAERLWPRRGR